MKMGGNKNFGYGRSIGYAIRNILIEKCLGQSGKTEHTNKAQLVCFQKFLMGQGIRDLRSVDLSVVEAYGRSLGDMVENFVIAVSTAQNRIAAVNRLMAHARADRAVWISPSQFVGRRSALAVDAPLSSDLDKVLKLVADLIVQEDYRSALLVLSCRLLGARVREASVLKLRPALRSVKKRGVVTITLGSKGGRARKIPRVITPAPEYLEIFCALERQIPDDSLIPKGRRFTDWYQDAYRTTKPLAERLGLATGFHDYRRAWACQKYAELTGCDAPCVEGRRIANKAADTDARRWLAEALGHGRTQIAGAYIGGVR